MLKATLYLILVVSFCIGEVSMGNPIDDFTEQKLIQFKHQIGYEKIVADLGPDKRYVVDWEEILSKFIDADGAKWRAEGEPDYYVFGPLGTVDVEISDGHESVSVEIRKGGDRLRSTVDSMLKIAASGSAPRVWMKVMTGRCPGDFCLITGTENAPDSMYMAKGNILARLNSSDDCSVLPVAQYIAKEMDKRNIDPKLSPLNKVSLQLKIDRTGIKLGEEFVFTVEPKSLFDDEEWLIDVRRENDEELGYVKDEAGQFTFKALTRGPVRISVNVMHKRTLQVKEETFVVTVN
jgi:hypothetical protein